MERTIDEFKEELSKEELEFFDSLAPSYQKNFFNIAYSGKKESTRIKNLEEVKDALHMKCKNIFDYKKKVNPREVNSSNLSDMEKIKLYFEKVEIEENRKKILNLYVDLIKSVPTLKELYAWNQPMITNNETFICGFSVAKNHFSIAFERDTLDLFKEQFEAEGYEILKKIIKIKWNQHIDEELIKSAIKYTVENKKNTKGFWQ